VYVAQENVIVGRNSICWECHEKFELDDEAMKEDQPRCGSCRHPETRVIGVDIDEIMREKSKLLTFGQSDDKVEVIEPDDVE